MTLQGTRFGEIEFSDSDIITFREGLIGFSAYQRFVVLENHPNSPFRWLQSAEDPALAFLVTDPKEYVPEYTPEISESAAECLALTNESTVAVLTTVNIPKGHPEDMTLNLAGPLLINAHTREGRQVVLEGDAYTIRHRVFQRADRETENVAA
jgi:flagellar assembly factor FliW